MQKMRKAPAGFFEGNRWRLKWRRLFGAVTKKPASVESLTNRGAVDVKPTYGSRSKSRGFTPARARANSRSTKNNAQAKMAKATFFQRGRTGSGEDGLGGPDLKPASGRGCWHFRFTSGTPPFSPARAR